MKIKHIIIFLLIFSISGILGWYIGLRQGIKIGGITREMGAFLDSCNYMKTLFKEGTCETVKQSILDFEKKVELRKETNDPWYDPTTFYGDKILIHGRIYLIDQKLKNTASAKQHMILALEACKKNGWEVCSEEKVVYFVKKINELNPITCLNKE